MTLLCIPRAWPGCKDSAQSHITAHQPDILSEAVNLFDASAFSWVHPRTDGTYEQGSVKSESESVAG
jgi:hypothetical protein